MEKKKLKPQKIVFMGIVFAVLIMPAVFAAAADVQQSKTPHLLLPQAMTPEGEMQKAHMLDLLSGKISPPGPGQRVHVPAEYFPQEAVMINWEGFTYFPVEYTVMTGAIIEVAQVIILHETDSQKDLVRSVLNLYGVDITGIEFMRFPTESLWTRDYGPFTFYDANSSRSMTDFLYYPSRPLDTMVRQEFSKLRGWNSYGENLFFEGGNFMTDGYGVCFISDAVLSDNPTMSDTEIKNIFREYCGCHTTHILKSLVDTTTHVDMFTKLLDVDTVIIGQVSEEDINHDILEDAVRYFESLTASNGLPYEILRVPMLSDFRTYTNALLVNGVALVPVYDTPEDEPVLNLYCDAGYIPVPVNASDMIFYGGAIHCLTRDIPDTCVSPAAPVDVAGMCVNNSNILVTWTGTGAPVYYVYRSESGPNKHMEVLATTGETYYIDSSVSTGKTYYYRICSVDFCLSELSNCVQVMIR